MDSAYEIKRDQIKKTAIRIFARYGYHKSTLDDIANSIGMKKNSLYYYFPNKEELFNELIQDEFEIFFKEIDKLIAARTNTTQKVKSILKKLITHSKERSSLYSTTFEVYLEIGEVVEKSHKEHRNVITEKLAVILKDGIKNGELKKHNSNELAEYLINITSSLAYKEIRKSDIQSFDQIDYSSIERTTSKIVDYVIDGLKC
ncbi:TetR/AcrR family transcriptional regulator [Bacteroidota bacterium]